MRVGTDAVLLGAWAEIKNSENILEIGTGCGIIALMLAQRNEKANITAIDIHAESVKEASRNFKESQWTDRLNVEEISFQNFKCQNKFDHIISNPPFFTASTPAPNKARHQARHTDTLSPLDFFINSKMLLEPAGLISIIIPFINSENWFKMAEQYGFFPSRITNVLSYPGKSAERILVEFSQNKKEKIENDFFIRKGKGLSYSDEYIEMTKEFYL